MNAFIWLAAVFVSGLGFVIARERPLVGTPVFVAGMILLALAIVWRDRP